MRLLVTGFGPFEGVPVNPAGLLAARCGCAHVLLEVSFEAVDRFLTGVDGESFDALLMIGVACGSAGFRLETLAKNEIGGRADVRGVVRESSIERGGAEVLRSTLWPEALLDQECADWSASSDAGTYLCNYALYRALQVWPEKRVGFLHVPPLEVMGIERQLEILSRLLGALRLTDAPAGRDNAAV